MTAVAIPAIPAQAPTEPTGRPLPWFRCPTCKRTYQGRPGSPIHETWAERHQVTCGTEPTQEDR